MTTVHEPPEVGDRPAVEAELAEPVATISRRLWAGTALLAVVLVVAVGWGWFGRWSQHLDTTAVVVHGTGPVVVVAPTSGTVTAVAAQPGDTVRAGTRLLTITAGGRELAVAATATGTVLSIIADGARVDDATTLAAVDPVTQQAHAYLLVSDTAALGRLAIGDRVGIDSPVGAFTGRVSGVRSTPTTTDALARWLAVPLSARSPRPVWLVEVALDPGTRVGVQTEASARVQLPSIRVYRALLGGGS